MKPDHGRMIIMHSTVDGLLEGLAQWKAPLVNKWIEPKPS